MRTRGGGSVISVSLTHIKTELESNAHGTRVTNLGTRHLHGPQIGAGGGGGSSGAASDRLRAREPHSQWAPTGKQAGWPKNAPSSWFTTAGPGTSPDESLNRRWCIQAKQRCWRSKEITADSSHRFDESPGNEVTF